jgi:hypothetical protein
VEAIKHCFPTEAVLPDAGRHFAIDFLPYSGRLSTQPVRITYDDLMSCSEAEGCDELVEGRCAKLYAAK